MEKVATIGLDIAKSVFQVHGVAADGEVLIRPRLTRAIARGLSVREAFAGESAVPARQP